MSAITVNGDLVHYEVLGRGRPVILLHSWLGSWRYWIPTMQQLSVKYRIYAIDMWGFGDSGKNKQYYDIDGQAELLERFLDRMGIPKAVFIGHGLGAAVMAHFANRPNCGSIVHRMMTISTPVFGSGFRKSVPAAAAKPAAPEPKPEPEPAKSEAPGFAFTVQSSTDSPTIQSVSKEERERLLKAAVSKLESDAKGESVPANAGNNSQPATTVTTSPTSSESVPIEDTAAGTEGSNPFATIVGRTKPQALLSRVMDASSSDYEKLKAEVDKADEEAIKQSAESLSQYNPLRNLLKISSPTLSIYGESDALVPPPDDEIKRSLDDHPQIKVMVLGSMRHFPMLEDTSRFTRLLREFLEVPDVETLKALEEKDEWKRRMR